MLSIGPMSTEEQHRRSVEAPSSEARERAAPSPGDRKEPRDVVGEVVEVLPAFGVAHVRAPGGLLLGLNRQGNWLTLAPCIPMHWPNYTLKYRHGASQYSIEIEHVDDGDATLQIDGVAQPDLWIELVDDGAIHCVRMRWPREQS